MIDASVDPDFASLERADSLKPRVAPAAPRVRRGVLATLPSQPPMNGTLILPESAAGTVAADAVVSPPDPLGHLQAARLGIFAVVVLVIYWLWLRKRRQAR